jgi:[ribosomal protein S18]-alanine N-acetyltransferase
VIRLELLSGGAVAALAAALAEIHQSCFPDDPWPPQAIVDIAAIPGVFGLLARDGDTPVGLALAQGLGEECEVLTLGVTTARRRTGFGRAMLAGLVSEARRRGSRSLFLEVAADNNAARALYAAQGFRQIGRRANYYRRAAGPADALVLRLSLAT